MSPKTAPTIFILAGEPSGDRIGANLIKELSLQGEFNFLGVGGNMMQEQGIKSLYEMDDLSVMGFADVLSRLPLLFWRLKQTAQYIIRTNPDLVILIDSQVFSSMLAKMLKKKKYKNPLLLYVAPSVWAWKPERAKKLVGIFDEILAILPFEVKVMKHLGGPKTSYVGHPAHYNKQPIEIGNEEKSTIAFYPGSRKGEIARHMPIFKRLAKKLQDNGKITGFILPTLQHLHDDIAQLVQDWDIQIEVISDEKEKFAALSTIKLAIVSTGTITLELALNNIPMLATYVPDKVQMAYYKKSGMPMVALPNIIIGKKIIPEIFPDQNLLENLYLGAIELLASDEKRLLQLTQFAKMRTLMELGEKDAKRQDPIDRILAHLGK